MGFLFDRNYISTGLYKTDRQEGQKRGLLSVYSWNVLQADEIKIGFATGNSCDKYHN